MKYGPNNLLMKISLTKQELKNLDKSSNAGNEINPDVYIQTGNTGEQHFILAFNERSFTFEVEVTD